MGLPEGLPVIEGEMDAAYLAAALERAERPAALDQITLKPFEDGRSATSVYAIASGADRYALKVFPRRTWWSELAGVDCVEVELWRRGVTRALPPPVECPTIDIAFHPVRDEYWMLMDDVSTAIAPRGSFDEERLRWLLDGLARLHARYWASEELRRLPIWPMAKRAEYLAGSVAAAGGAAAVEGWVATSLDKIKLFRLMVPVFLDALGPGDADLYLAHCAKREPWLKALARHPFTLTQGDVRRANFAAFSPQRVSVFDWDYATHGPAAHDIAWYWYLQFWCYPPPDGRSEEDLEPLRIYYRERLNQELGGRLDTAAFEAAYALCWIWVFAEIGYILVDPLLGTPSESERERVRSFSRRAMDRLKRTYDAHVR